MEKEVEFDSIPTSTKKLIGLVNEDAAPAEVREKAREILQDRLGPWKMESRGLITLEEREEIIERRLRVLTDEIDELIERVIQGVFVLALILGGAALGGYVHEGWFIVPLLIIGSAVLTGGPSLVGAPFLLTYRVIQRAAVRKGMSFDIFGFGYQQYHIEPGSTGPQWDHLDDLELLDIARDRGVSDYKALSREDLIRRIADLDGK